jgi:hypothetical protein
MTRTFRVAALLLAAGLAATAGAARAAEGEVLQGVQVIEKDDTIDLQIDFAIPLQYMRHFPPTTGDILQIQLRADAEAPAAEKPAEDAPAEQTPEQVAQEASIAAARSAAKRESLSPPATDLVPLVNVNYEGEVPGGPFLTLRFKFGVEYTVAAGPANRSVIVSVKREAGGGARVSGGDAEAMTDEKLDELMVDARQNLAREEYGRSIQLLSKLLQLPNHKYSQEAKELMGVARERKGQVARAKLEYQEYLRLYPEGEGADRVKQRLAGIELAQVEPREKLKEVKPTAKTTFDTFGRFSQRYYSDQTTFKSSGSFEGGTDSRSTLTSFLNVSGRYRSDEYDIRSFFNAHDVRTLQGSGDDNTEINSVYADVRNKPNKVGALVGRQSSNKGGVFGRFDGAWVSYEIKPKTEIAATVGKPVGFSSSDIDADRVFFGTSVAFGTFKEFYDANAYYIEQKVEGMVDRRAVGGDLRYTQKFTSMFASIDYDLFYGKMNILFLRGGWKVNDQTRVDVNYNVRQSPLLMTTNALQQEGITSFKELQAVATEAEIRAKVPQVSSLSRMLTIGAVYEFDQNNQLNADVTVSSIDGKPATAKLNDTTPNDSSDDTIAAQEKYGPEYSYSVQLISSNYLVERDIHIVGGRYSTGESRTTTSLFVRSRFPYKEQWYFGPRVQLDQTKNDADGSNLTHPSVAIKADYRWKKTVSFEAELGYDINDYSGGSTSSLDYSRMTLFLGYNVDF